MALRWKQNPKFLTAFNEKIGNTLSHFQDEFFVFPREPSIRRFIYRFITYDYARINTHTTVAAKKQSNTSQIINKPFH